MRQLFLPAVFVLVSASNASGHEFWIDPEDFTISPGDKVSAELIIGQEFEGSGFPYIPGNIERFDLVSGDSIIAVRSRIGDRPALNQAIPDDGLWIVVHETQDQRLTYVEEGVFEEFVTHKDLKGTLEAHADRGLPILGFSENYRRFAKALIAVGSGNGADETLGLRTELTALDNPYDPSFDGQMQVRLTFEGAPRVDAQVEVFERGPDGQVSIGTTRTNADGIAGFATKPDHVYLVDAVKMLPLDGDEAGIAPVWYSLWASLTFAVPE